MAQHLKIMAWNANGLLQHHEELHTVLNEESIDICLISESHMTDKTDISMPGFKIYNTNHPSNTARGGSAVIIRENIIHHEDTKYDKEEIQATTVNIQRNNQFIKIAAIYSPPRCTIKQNDYTNFLRQLGERFILGGDFNAKNTNWGSRLTTTKGRELYKSMKELKCEALSTGKPTYWPTDHQKIPDLIDFFICKNISTNYLQVEEGYDMSSDHSTILLTYSKHIKRRECIPHLTNERTDWTSFRIELERRINLNTTIITDEELDMEIDKFNTDIQQSAWNNTPTSKIKHKSYIYPKEIKELITTKRKQRKKWHQTRNPADKNILNKLTKNLKNKIRVYKENTMTKYLENLTNDRKTDYSLWKATKKINKPTVHNSPIRNVKNNAWAKTDIEKVHLFSEHLENIFQPNNGNNIQPTEISITQNEGEIDPTTIEEIEHEIKFNLSPKKSPGFDLINGRIMKMLPRKAVIKLSQLINTSFKLRYVPSLWKTAEIIMIPKPGKPQQETASYRPISLLPIISKIFEKILLKRLKKIIQKEKLIPDHQFGFRENHSTIDQIHRITNIIEKTLEEKKVCSTIFLDVAQAFDKVWHEGLDYKLKTMLPKHYTDILKSYLSLRTFRVRLNNTYSDLKEINAGVPQGSVLGPVLYLLYTCDIPTFKNGTIATFADDTAIMAIGDNHSQSTQKVQSAVNRIVEWTDKWRIKLNESKSVHIDFTNKREQYHPVRINNQVIPYSNTAKYLGLTLDAKLRWKAHVKKKKEELGIRYQKMNWLIGRRSPMSIKSKIMVYNQILKPVWTYGIQLWGCTKQANIKILQTFQNKVLRDIINAPWYIRNSDIHRDLNIDYVKDVIKTFAERHQQRLQQHVNIEAKQLLDNTTCIRRLKRTKPQDLI